MSCASCRYFDSCSAPLCTEDPASLEKAIWYPGEPVCRAYSDPWIFQAKRISRRLGRTFDCGAFTVEMLRQQCRVTRGLKGLDAEKHPITAERVERWLSDHPALSAESRARSRAQAIHNLTSGTVGVKFRGHSAVGNPELAPEIVSQAGLTAQ